MYDVFRIVLRIIDIVYWVIIANVIMSWLVNFNVVNLRQPLVAQIWNGLQRLVEPIYAPIRRILPPISGLDLAPLVVLIGIYALRIVLVNNMMAFY